MLGKRWANDTGVYYLTIIPRVLVGYEMVYVDGQRAGYNHLISNKREWNNCFIENAHKNIENSSRLYLFKKIDFQIVSNFEQTRTVTIFGEHGIMVHVYNDG